MPPTKIEIEAAAEQAAILENEEESTGIRKYPAQSYMQGVRAALDWAAGNIDDPLEDIL